MFRLNQMKSIIVSIFLSSVVFMVGCNGGEPPFMSSANDASVFSSNDSSTVKYDVNVVSDGDWFGDSTVCGLISRVPELPPFDIMMAIDTSYSMDFQEKWISIKAALKVFAQDASFSSLGVGLQYFPLRAQCSVSDYQMPDVSIAPLPMIQSQFVDSLDKQRMFGGTPMVPMLTGVMKYAKTRAAAFPDREVAIVLATDGVPDDTCLIDSAESKANTLKNLIDVAKSGVAASPKVSVFVIGVGSELTALNQIAVAGGTDKAFLLDANKNIETAFLAALDSIRLTMACEYDIPDPPSGDLLMDYSKVQVQFSVNGQNEIFFDPVDGANNCTPNGWYFNDPNNPTKIVLCDEACKKSHQEGGKMDVRFGCKYRPK